MMKNKDAFTLIETVIGITLITVVLAAVTGLILTTLLANSRNLHTVQASFFAQEGVEVMRHVRDSNWLQNYSWDGGSAEWNYDFDVAIGDSVTLYLKDQGCAHEWCFSMSSADGVVTNGNGFEFQRGVTVDVVAAGTAEVTALVEWDDKGVAREYELSTYLTDWK